MKYKKFTDLVFKSIPKFKEFYTEDLDENYYNSFLGDFGLFTKDSILNKESYGDESLEFINNIYNKNYLDREFTNMLDINILEILTDTQETQKKSLNIFTSHCLLRFQNLLKNSFYDLT